MKRLAATTLLLAGLAASTSLALIIPSPDAAADDAAALKVDSLDVHACSQPDTLAIAKKLYRKAVVALLGPKVVLFDLDHSIFELSNLRTTLAAPSGTTAWCRATLTFQLQPLAAMLGADSQHERDALGWDRPGALGNTSEVQFSLEQTDDGGAIVTLQQ